MSGVQARLAAAELLVRVLEERRTLDEALLQTTSFSTLVGSDRGFARAMVSAVLRHLGQINLCLAPILNRPLEEASVLSRAFLQIGAAQLWVLGTPAHAGVGETVSAAKQSAESRKTAGFLNAVLRKAALRQADFAQAPVLSVWPHWLQQVMVDSVGKAQAEALARLQMREPNLHLSCKNNNIDRVEAAFRDAGIEAEQLSSDTVSVPTGAVEAYPLYADGVWWVQDAAAALPAKLLGACSGKTYIDLCAAPGGKTMQLAAAGADIFAIDRSKKRLERVENNLKRTGLTGNVRIIPADGQAWRADVPVDGVLVDAPCSALGTLRRHPEGAWIKKASEIARYPDIQKRLLRAAFEQVKPGGQIVYCVCSPLRAEGQDVVDTVLAEETGKRLPVRPEEVAGFEHAVTPAGDLRTLPGGSFGHDAFFISRLVKL